MTPYSLLALPVIVLGFTWYTVPAQAPALDMPQFTERDATDQRPRVHQVKLFYDRVGPEFEAYRQPRCAMPGRIWWRGACWKPDRIVENME